MIELNENNIKNAVEKARVTKPKVRVIEFRRYAVTNDDGKTYIVTFAKICGKKFADCDCIAGQRSKHPCYHVGAASGIHLVLAAQRQVATA